MHQISTDAVTRALALVAAGLMITAGFAGVVAAGGPTSGEQLSENVTVVTACGTLDEPGQYVLQGNITDAPGDGCFDVTADGVTILGSGHAVSGPNGTGTAISATGVDDLTVQNLRLSGWGTGVALDSVSGAELTNLTIIDSAVVGVSFAGESQDATIQDSRVAEGTVGVRVGSEGQDVAVRGSQFTNLTGAGVDVRGTHTVVANNTVRETGAAGVRLTDAENALVADNRIVRTIGGVVVTNTDGAVVRGNELRGVRGPSIHVSDDESAQENRTQVGELSLQASLFGGLGESYWLFSGLGVSFADGSDATPARIVNNSVLDGNGHGIYVDTADAWIAENRVAWTNDGIRVDNATNVSVVNNSVSDNRDDGVAFAASADGVVRGNELTNNADDGLYVVGDGATVTDNVATNNGDDGVDVHNSTVDSVTGNRLANNGDDGLYLRNVDTGNVTANTVRWNTDDGIDLRGSTNLTVWNNTVCGNTHHQIVQRLGAAGNQLRNNGC